MQSQISIADPESRPRVLVADDDDSIRMLLVRLLRRSGFTAIEAEDGAVAIEQLEAGTFDAVLLDLMMPRVDGFGVIDHLIRTRPCMLERTVVVTAFPQTAARERLNQVCAVMSKPFEIERLLAAVRDCVRAGKESGQCATA